jgi:hypothetical protein
VTQAGIDLVEQLVAGAGGGRQPWSDYHYLRAAGVPFVFLSNGQTQHSHQPSDDFATLDLDKLDRQTTWLSSLVGALLELPAGERPRFEPFARPDVDLAATLALVQGALTADAFPDSAEILQRDLERARRGDARVLRAVVQRVQCLAVGRYPRALCHGLGQ